MRKKSAASRRLQVDPGETQAHKAERDPSRVRGVSETSAASATAGVETPIVLSSFAPEQQRKMTVRRSPMVRRATEVGPSPTALQPKYSTCSNQHYYDQDYYQEDRGQYEDYVPIQRAERIPRSQEYRIQDQHSQQEYIIQDKYNQYSECVLVDPGQYRQQQQQQQQQEVRIISFGI